MEACEEEAIRDVYFRIDLDTLRDTTPWAATGWGQIDHEITEIEKMLWAATEARGCQGLASRCRDLLISLAQKRLARRI